MLKYFIGKGNIWPAVRGKVRPWPKSVRFILRARWTWQQFHGNPSDNCWDILVSTTICSFFLVSYFKSYWLKMYYFAQIYSVCIPLLWILFCLCLRRKQPKMSRFTALCDLFISFSQTCVESGQQAEKAKPNLNTHWLLAAQQLYSAQELVYFDTGMPAVRWSLSWVISNVCPDKSLILLLEVIKPLLSTSSKLLHIPPSLLSQTHGKSDRHVCVCVCGFRKEWQSVILCQVLFEQKTQRWAAGVRTHWTWRSAWSLEKEEPSQAFILGFAHAL